MTALAIAELSTTEAIATCVSCLLCRSLFSWVVVVPMRDRDAWAQLRCSAAEYMEKNPQDFIESFSEEAPSM